MSKITAIRRKGMSQDRFVVEVDEKAVATLDLTLVQKFELHVGDELPDRTREELVEAGRSLGTFDRAVRMLSSRGRARGDLQRKLVGKGELAVDAAKAVAKLGDMGLIDDDAFARQYTRAKAGAHGSRRISADLRRQGVPADVSTKAVADVLADPSSDAGNTLPKLIEKRLRQLSKLDEATRDRRLTGFLARRGFGGEEIRKALKAAKAGTK